MFAANRSVEILQTPPSSGNELVQKTSAFKKLRRSIIKKKIRWNGGEKSAEKTVVNDSSAMRPGPLVSC